MSWQHAIVVGFLALACLMLVGQIGKERDPITPGIAAATLVVHALLIWGILAG